MKLLPNMFVPIRQIKLNKRSGLIPRHASYHHLVSSLFYRHFMIFPYSLSYLSVVSLFYLTRLYPHTFLNSCNLQITMLSREQLTDLNEHFPTVSTNGSGFLARSDVQTALKILGIDVPGYKVSNHLKSTRMTSGRMVALPRLSTRSYLLRQTD